MDGALDFTSDSTALDWAGKTFHRFDKNDAAKRALKTYTGGSYRAWNDALRAAEGSALPKGWEDLTRDADAGIDRSPFPEDTSSGAGPPSTSSSSTAGSVRHTSRPRTLATSLGRYRPSTAT